VYGGGGEGGFNSAAVKRRMLSWTQEGQFVF
jgi:hypothetical protein